MGQNNRRVKKMVGYVIDPFVRRHYLYGKGVNIGYRAYVGQAYFLQELRTINGIQFGEVLEFGSKPKWL